MSEKKFFGLLTEIGEIKEANALALGVRRKITQMGVCDGNGAEFIPDRKMRELPGLKRRAALNSLGTDKENPGWIIAEQVIPEMDGGFWIRGYGLYDEDGDLVAVANCAPSYKPVLAEGSGKTQVLRMVLMVGSVATYELKIDPAIVLATRKYVDDGLQTRLGKDDTAKAATKLAAGRKIAIGGPISATGVVFDGSKDISLTTSPLQLDTFLVGNGTDPIRTLTTEQARDLLDVQVRNATMIITQSGDVAIPPAWRGKRVRYQIIGGGGGGGNGATGWGNQSVQSPDVSGGGGGGGGAGEYKTGEFVLPMTATLSCTIGAGGAGGTTFSGHMGAGGFAGGISAISNLVSANGGSGGGGGGGSNIQARTFGGVPGGLGASGGQPGTSEVYSSSGVIATNAIPGNGGNGGATPFGCGGAGGGRSGQRLYSGGTGGMPTPNSGGGGGGGGGANGPTNGSADGGDGADGKIILELIG